MFRAFSTQMKMSLVKTCCICISNKTGAFILGTIGIIVGCTLLAPVIVFLEYHSFYITQYAQTQRDSGYYLEDENVPYLELFSKLLYSILLALDVIYIFSCIFLLVGLSTNRHLFIIPWLVLMGSAIVLMVTLVLSFIIGLADYNALAVFLGSSPVLVTIIYFWLVVLSAYQAIRNENSPTNREGPTASASQSSLTSIKDGIQRVLGGTPPPPYEAVTTELKLPKGKKSLGRQNSTESSDSGVPFLPVADSKSNLELESAIDTSTTIETTLGDTRTSELGKPNEDRITEIYQELISTKSENAAANGETNSTSPSANKSTGLNPNAQASANRRKSLASPHFRERVVEKDEDSNDDELLVAVVTSTSTTVVAEGQAGNILGMSEMKTESSSLSGSPGHGNGGGEAEATRKSAGYGRSYSDNGEGKSSPKTSDNISSGRGGNSGSTSTTIKKSSSIGAGLLGLANIGGGNGRVQPAEGPASDPAKLTLSTSGVTITTTAIVESPRSTATNSSSSTARNKVRPAAAKTEANSKTSSASKPSSSASNAPTNGTESGGQDAKDQRQGALVSSWSSLSDETSSMSSTSLTSPVAENNILV